MQKIRLTGWLFAGALAILLLSPTTGSGTAARLAGESSPDPVLLFVQDEPTAVNGYPGPAETSPLSTTEAYPAVQTPPAPADTTMPYPAVTTEVESTPLPVPIIGEEVESTAAPETAALSQQANAGQAVRGRLFLWGGFIVALLLFATGIAGAIVLFTRRRG